jgi:hypothetical protein
MGAVFYQTDFINPDVFAAKVAKQFLFGAMLGWFSLGGRDNAKPPVALFDLLMSPAHDSEVLYVKLLSDARQFLVPFIMLGRASRDLPVVINGSTRSDGAALTSITSSAKSASASGQLVGALLHQSWVSRDGRLLIALTNSLRAGDTHVAFDIPLAHYGVVSPACVLEMSAQDGSRHVLQSSVTQLSYAKLLPGRSLTLLLVCPGVCGCA